MNRRKMLIASAASLLASSGLARAQLFGTYNDPDSQEIEVWLPDADYWNFSEDVNDATGSSDASGVCRVTSFQQGNYVTVEYTSGYSFATLGDAAQSVFRALTSAMYSVGLAPPISQTVVDAHLGNRG